MTEGRLKCREKGVDGGAEATKLQSGAEFHRCLGSSCWAVWPLTDIWERHHWLHLWTIFCQRGFLKQLQGCS